MISALPSLLTDVCQDVRDAAVSKIEAAPTPDVLLGLCGLPVATIQAIPGAMVHRLADRAFRMLLPDQRGMVLRHLAQAEFDTAGNPEGWSLTNLSGRVSPDWVNDDILDLEIILLLQGLNAVDEPVYSYVMLLGGNMRQMFVAWNAGQKFNPRDYGTILFADTGEVPLEIMEVMRDRYSMTDVPEPPPTRYRRRARRAMIREGE
jgi:hypothetical protein